MSRNRPIPILSEADRELAESLIVSRDAGLLVLNKPSGLAVQTRGNRGQCLDHLLWTFARSNGKRPRLVHRIDTGTSGLIVAAETKPLTAHLSTAFAERRVTKTYLAWVDGGPDTEAGTCQIPLLKHGREMIPAPGGVPVRKPRREQGGETPVLQQAQTEWRVVERRDGASLIEAKPVTGRMHQIRVHLSALGCPILGDRIYGRAQTAPRLLLHALNLNLPMPDGSNREFVANPPDNFCVIELGA